METNCKKHKKVQQTKNIQTNEKPWESHKAL